MAIQYYTNGLGPSHWKPLKLSGSLLWRTHGVHASFFPKVFFFINPPHFALFICFLHWRIYFNSVLLCAQGPPLFTFLVWIFERYLAVLWSLHTRKGCCATNYKPTKKYLWQHIHLLCNFSSFLCNLIFTANKWSCAQIQPYHLSILPQAQDSSEEGAVRSTMFYAWAK